MKHIIILLVAAAVSASVFAAKRQHSEANIEVTYQYDYAVATVDSLNYKSDKMLLQIAPDESRFFSVKTEFYDSLAASPGGKDMINDMVLDALNKSGGIKRDTDGNITSVTVSYDAMKDVPRRGVCVNVYKYPGENIMTVYDRIQSGDNALYTWDVPCDEIVWEPGDSTMTILGYECQSATADYHGRLWTAWYAPEIPVSEGPWQFCGLPGLILYAVSDGDEYRFTATAINRCNTQIKDIPGEPHTEKCTRKDFRMLEADIVANPGKNYGIAVPNKGKVHHDLIETDYR
ncbi:MAG: GLPGLI family protein [Muribaculaceae bacterium]|nr:GLPGLI family protein [Muribaculaceae bacterium]